ncbi:hypoxanthine phosphoribosyltransferase [Planctomycetales bacterium]|nr:hypoxanthine phosphoribosyltransferase [Planctomycetales bacterium]GHT02620.1 hypoxanthine phosphoribosyltransferase [Planctomycetales bacterium]
MSPAIEKVLISAEEERRDCWELAARIVKQDAPFDVVAGLTRGGLPIAIYLQEFFMLAYRRPVGFACVRCRSYDGVARAGNVRVGSLDEVWTELGERTRVLIVDDVFDRGSTAQAVINKIRADAPRPLTVKTAVLHYKPENSQVSIVPDYYLRVYRGDQWLVYPAAVSDLADDADALRRFGMPEKILAGIREKLKVES